MQKKTQIEIKPPQRFYDNSHELCLSMREKYGEVIVSFSMGKDSLATYFQLLNYWPPEKIHLVFMYLVPGLEFQEVYLRKYEKAFNKRIIRMPNPEAYNILTSGAFQTPLSLPIIKHQFLEFNYELDFEDIFLAAREDLNLPPDTPVAIGNRIADNPMRAMSLKKWGVYTPHKFKFYPIFDFNLENLVEIIDENNGFLPIDYKLWGRTFDGFEYMFIKPLRENFPEDYDRIKTFYPLIDAVFIRHGDFSYCSPQVSNQWKS